MSDRDPYPAGRSPMRTDRAGSWRRTAAHESRGCGAARRLLPRLLLCLMLPAVPGAQAAAQGLRVATANIWSGLDYEGTWSVGEYETAGRRELRTRALIENLARAAPDVIALQEVNPAGALSRRIAAALGYDVIHQRVNAGVKIRGAGIPVNLNEGLSILARKELALRHVDVISLSGTFGVFGDAVSCHVSEVDAALAGSIRVDGATLIIVSVHLDASVPDLPETRARLDSLIAAAGMDAGQAASLVREFEAGAARRGEQIRVLVRALAELRARGPVLVLGDFNTASDSPELLALAAEAGLRLARGTGVAAPTWDPARNANIRLQLDAAAASDVRTPLQRLSDWYDTRPRRIDHILIDTAFRAEDVLAATLLLEEGMEGIPPSDHFGVMADVHAGAALAGRPRDGDAVPERVPPAWDVLAAPVYDTNVGFGVVGKTVLLNQLGARESFDLTLFGSTLGERWVRLAFSLPNMEIRQGRVYAWAVDVVIDYDLFLKNSFFGVGNRSRYEDREYFTREPLDLRATVSRGISTTLVAHAGLRYTWVRNMRVPEGGLLAALPSPLSRGRAALASVFAGVRHDSRDSYLHPSRGTVLSVDAEYAPALAFTHTSFLRLGGWAQWYGTLWYPKTILALRASVQGLIGDDIPVQHLLSIGGNRTLRGSPQDRYLDAVSAVATAELRFPIVWRFGGVLGCDAGKVWHHTGEIDLHRWETNPVAGLRFYYDTFVVRADAGFGRHGTGLYLNFDHVF